MSGARDDFAAKLNGRQYREEISRAEEAEAKAARLLVVFGASDDLTEFRGLIHDEAGAWGAAHRIGRIGDRWAVLDLERCGDGAALPQGGAAIEAVWSPKNPGASWLIKPSIPFAPFDVMEDGDLYCRGAVIDEADLLPAQRVLGVSRDLNPKTMLVSFSAPLADADLSSVHEFLRGWSR